MTSTVIVRYGELALKSEPVRKRFERCLINSIKRSLRNVTYTIRTERGRIFIDTTATAKTVKILSQLPGITSISPAVKTKADLDAIKVKVTTLAKKILKPGMSFAVRTTRIGEHAFSSRDINIAIGSYVLSLLNNLKVDLSHPDVEISIEIRDNDAYVFSKTVRGVGGLPVGTQGKVVAIFSGDKKDAIAAFMMLKRGCMVTPLILDAYDGIGNHRTGLTIAQAERLSLFGAATSLWLFPFKDLLNQVQKKTDSKFSFIIRRRCELRAAELVARRIAAEAVVTGDDAQSIAGIMLPNLHTIDAACQLPVLRPLSGLEVNEIKKIGVKIGLKLAKGSKLSHPLKGAVISAEEILEQEGIINVRKIIEDASEKIRKIEVR
ncbi:MAG: THUMP domain-containing protein [Candidatus Hadarchaeum sp.]